MKRSVSAGACVLTLVLGSLGAVTSTDAAPAPDRTRTAPADSGQVDVYVARVGARGLAAVRSLGLDVGSLEVSQTSGDQLRVEMLISGLQAARLRAGGVDAQLERVDGKSAAQRSTDEARGGFRVFRSYSEPGGIADELRRVARNHPRLTDLVRIGRTVRDKPILAIKLTKGAGRVPDGSRPAVLYSSAQHAREWITPEMNRRLLHFMLDKYNEQGRIRQLVNTTELWFVPVANPDGYDYTFRPGNRLWRKNLRDNNRDGRITAGDGVDLNRNFETKWGYDNEGSSPDPASDTYRGRRPSSEPETRAMDRLLRRVDFEFQINYHSAAELLLYGTGWQVATPTPDDLIYEALAGDDADPAVAGYDPDISAELYTTNGETTEHASTAYQTIAFTPEMSTCQTASASDPNDNFEPEDCQSGFNFPDREQLIQTEFRKNIPFAVAVGRSAQDPTYPVSVVDERVPNFKLDRFRLSYGDPQPVAVWARRSLRQLQLRYAVNGGTPQSTGVREWDGGERYGDEGDDYIAEYRGKVRGTDPGDRVRVWFTGVKARNGGDGNRVRSKAFSYRLVSDRRARVLVVANEDYTGVNPNYPDGVTSPKYDVRYQQALRDAGERSAVWDVDRQGVPHDLGVLRHFDTVVWYLGDNRLTMDREDRITETFGGNFPDLAVAQRQQYLTMRMRDYLNQGGRLLHTGETAAYYGLLGSGLGGIYYGLDGAPREDCVVTSDPFSDCLLLSDDFSQYYLGAFGRGVFSRPQAISGTSRPLRGLEAPFGGSAVRDNPVNEAGALTITSDVLPARQFPRFASKGSSEYLSESGRGPFDPVEGQWFVAGSHADDSFMRLTRTIDLTGVPAADNPALRFALNFDTEPGYDNVIVEAHTEGTNDWTTLQESGGLSDQGVPTECEANFLLNEHPWLEHYLTRGDPCQPQGDTGEWNRATGSTRGWQQVAYDLSQFAGSNVEVSISYVTDPSTGGFGAFVDDTRATAGSAELFAEGFENGLGGWSIPGEPPGSPVNSGDFQRSQAFIDISASTTTRDSVLFGFGAEQVASRADRADLLGRAVGYLRR